MQIYSMIDVPSEQLKLFGLGLEKGRQACALSEC